MPELSKKHTRNGIKYFTVELDTGTEIIFKLKDEKLVSPSTIKKADLTEVYKAARFLQDNGYTITDEGLVPEGFTTDEL